MKNKGIAIETILFLLIGVLVVGIVVYQIYKTFTGQALSQQECRQKLVSWCNTCAVLNFTTSIQPMGLELADCINKYFSSGWSQSCPCSGNATSNSICSGKTTSDVYRLCKPILPS